MCLLETKEARRVEEEEEVFKLPLSLSLSWNPSEKNSFADSSSSSFTFLETWLERMPVYKHTHSTYRYTPECVLT